MKDLKEEIEKISKEISVLEKERSQLMKDRKEESEFKVGERVKVFEHSKSWRSKEVTIIDQGFGFVDRISVDNEGVIHYSLKKEKKDGTPSAFGFGYGTYKIEKI